MLAASSTGEILLGNSALCQSLGSSQADLRGRLRSTLLGRWCLRIERDVRQALARKRASRYTLVVHNGSGEARGGWLTLATFRRDEDIVGVCGIVALMATTKASAAAKRICAPAIRARRARLPRASAPARSADSANRQRCP